jgi:predicted Zn-dependent protease
MIKRKIMQLSLGLLLGMNLFIAPAQAEWISHQEANVQLNVPNGWKQDTSEDGILIIGPQDESLMVMFWVLDGEDMEAVLAAFEPEFEKIVTNIKYTKTPESFTINGMKAIYVEGTGQVEGEPAEFEVAIIIAAKPLIVVSIAQKGAFLKHQSNLTKMVKSIQAIK